MKSFMTLNKLCPTKSSCRNKLSINSINGNRTTLSYSTNSFNKRKEVQLIQIYQHNSNLKFKED